MSGLPARNKPLHGVAFVHDCCCSIDSRTCGQSAIIHINGRWYCSAHDPHKTNSPQFDETLESGAILRTLPARVHVDPKGYDSYASYLDAERRKLQEPSQSLRMKELRRRAAMGDSQAMYDLAQALVLSDQETDGLCPRIVWILEAARRGHVQAMLEAAGIYFGGLGLPQDLAEARHWVSLAAATGNPEAKEAMGAMFPSKN